ncbi:hypothetical protein DNU06_10045 [Putridiphycobacter roseus]|uniref:GIY-YIG catalytic domain-containing protein n=1 Tax=Putridiphycobacter roseus TaxID=2219161 RepID=A0A2W1NGB5_9FLAO|nr:hypothetical protein [Putridiphycobacter roseus]PZE17076.1 hypothetical protein DNU06_10045 [Putridiphycobacter roseus]
MKFIKGNPKQAISVPDLPGNYIICLKPSSTLCNNLVSYTEYEKLKVLYTGISSKSLRKRDIKQHFYGHAGQSTLRKSIGSLMGLNKIPRDQSNPTNGKTKFTAIDEAKLTEWMLENLAFFYCVSNNPIQFETSLIAKFNPPLNISKNYNSTNKSFRQDLKMLRRKV